MLWNVENKKVLGIETNIHSLRLGKISTKCSWVFTQRNVQKSIFLLITFFKGICTR